MVDDACGGMENAMSSIAGSMFMIESPCRTSKKNQSYLPRACRVPAACYTHTNGCDRQEVSAPAGRVAVAGFVCAGGAGRTIEQTWHSLQLWQS